MTSPSFGKSIMPGEMKGGDIFILSFSDVHFELQPKVNNQEYIE
jgi:hypothetical protein